jgi:hypothetical protein
MNEPKIGAARPRTLYVVECYDKAGRLKWTERFSNLVMTAGKDKLLDATFKTGLTTPAWYVGLVGAKTTGYAAADTMASHGGWTESTAYSNANRPTFTAGTISAGSVDNSAAKAVFNVNGSATLNGAFLADNNTKGGTTGTLYGAGDFAAQRAVESGDTLNVQTTLSIT